MPAMAVPQRSAPDIDNLRNVYVGKDVSQAPKPAAVLDRAKVRRHCQSLLDAVDSLGVDFRAHVKTHKTKEGTRLQVGETGKDVKLVVSTIAELEHLLPVLREFQEAGRNVNVLYGIPLPSSSQVSRLAALACQLGAEAVSVLVDHAAQLSYLPQFYEQAGFQAGVYLKVDTGYHRAGLPPLGLNKDGLIAKLARLESQGQASFTGLYSHSSLSYADSTPEQTMTNLEGEVNGCLDALHANAQLFPDAKEITISVGASPQVTSVEDLVGPGGGSASKHAQSLRDTMGRVATGRPDGFRTRLELHAGVYSVLDVQQLATRSRVSLGGYEDEIALSVVADVCSVYNEGERPQPEALVAVGVLGLGREPCVAYKGWGIVDREAYCSAELGSEAEPKRRLIVDRVSQEHCIVSWAREGEGGEDAGQVPPMPFEVGQSIRIYPNHACIAGAMYGWYLVVDSSAGQDPTRIVDVWVRASGW